jgi:hypothetical protein
VIYSSKQNVREKISPVCLVSIGLLGYFYEESLSKVHGKGKCINYENIGMMGRYLNVGINYALV